MNEAKSTSDKQDADVKTKPEAEVPVVAKVPQAKVDVLAGVKHVIALNLGLTDEEREELSVDDVVTDGSNRLGMDELDRVDVEFGLEDEFDVDISDDEFVKAGTIGGLVRVIEAKVSGSSRK
jgi:acyl carrier protein